MGKLLRVNLLFVCAGFELYENECSCGWGRLSCAVGYPDETGEMSNWIFHNWWMMLLVSVCPGCLGDRCNGRSGEVNGLSPQIHEP